MINQDGTELVHWNLGGDFEAVTVADPSVKPLQVISVCVVVAVIEQELIGALSFTQVAPKIVPSYPPLVKSFKVVPEPSEKL